MLIDILKWSLRDVWHGTDRLRAERPFDGC